MASNRREFVGGMAGLALASAGGRAGATPAIGDAPPRFRPALEAIDAYAREHQAWVPLPALTLSVTVPDGPANVMNHGIARPGIPVGPDTLFQIGSISKCMTAAVLHQLAAEGRLRLDADIRALLPEIPWPDEGPIRVQQVLDHVSGLPEGAPPFPATGRLWLGFSPGTHWSYSNLGYACLGMLAERIEGRPLGRILHARLLAPLGMKRSRGAIVGTERAAYAQGYEATDMERPFVPGAALAPAAWVEEISGAGCVASTAADMALFLRGLAGAVQGRGGLGLDPERGRAYANHHVAASGPAPGYGNGLMRVESDGREYLHHTGGMVSFSSSFHLDPESGIGAFASSTISAYANYRPRLLTLFAVKALRAAAAGAPPPAPPPLEPPLKNAADYAGRYAGAGRGFEIRPGPNLTLVADGRTTRLYPVDDDVFATADPAFAEWPVLFERDGGKVVSIGWGPARFARNGAPALSGAPDPALARLAGRYINDSPWLGTAKIVERGGRLWAGGVTPLARMGDDLWRVGKDAWAPERARFADVANGRPQTLILSGDRFERRDV